MSPLRSPAPQESRPLLADRIGELEPGAEIDRAREPVAGNDMHDRGLRRGLVLHGLAPLADANSLNRARLMLAVRRSYGDHCAAIFHFCTTMEWDDIKHFLAVARSGSLTDAARELKSSAATVGRRVAELKSKLGARLFDRSQAGYSLTECGEAIRLKAEDIEEAVLAIEREAGGRDRRATGRVRLAATEDMATYLIAPRLPDFRRDCPGISLESNHPFSISPT